MEKLDYSVTKYQGYVVNGSLYLAVCCAEKSVMVSIFLITCVAPLFRLVYLTPACMCLLGLYLDIVSNNFSSKDTNMIEKRKYNDVRKLRGDNIFVASSGKRSLECGVCQNDENIIKVANNLGIYLMHSGVYNI